MNLSFQEVQAPVDTGVSKRQMMLEEQDQEEPPRQEVKVPRNDWENPPLNVSMLHSRNLFKDAIDDDKLSSSHHELPQHFRHSDASQTSHFDSSPPVERFRFKKKKPSSTFKVITKEMKKQEPQKPKKRLLTLKDLENMPFTEIKKLPIYNYGGDLYQRALQMAEQAEKQERLKEAEACKIKKVEFVINYATNFGEVISLTGDSHKLGKWTYKGQVEDYSLRIQLEWSEHHFWHTCVEADELPFHFEYKYIVVEGERVARWEKGQNRVFDYDDLSTKVKEAKQNQPQYIKGPALLEIKHSIDKSSKVVFDESEGLLTIRNQWSQQ